MVWSPDGVHVYPYLEKLVLQGELNKQNCRLFPKTSSDLHKCDMEQLIDKLKERFQFNRCDLTGFEFMVLLVLQAVLHLPKNQVFPHYDASLEIPW